MLGGKPIVDGYHGKTGLQQRWYIYCPRAFFFVALNPSATVNIY
jgi:hypothetical protein